MSLVICVNDKQQTKRKETKSMKDTLIVVDMQNDFIDGSLGTKEAVAIVPNVAKKIKEYREAGKQVIFTRDTHCLLYTSNPISRYVERCIPSAYPHSRYKKKLPGYGQEFVMSCTEMETRSISRNTGTLTRFAESQIKMESDSIKMVLLLNGWDCP